MTVNISSMAAGPHPRRELTLTLRLGFARPRLSVAAGAFSAGTTHLPHPPYLPYLPYLPDPP